MGTDDIVPVGRNDELARINAVLDAEELPDGIVLEGEPGVGKTTVWREGIRLAEQRGYTVLSAAGSPAEAQLSFTALGDLLGGHAEEVISGLPAPQRHALEIVLLLAEPGTKPPDARSIGVACLSALRAIASSRPVVVAVDDAQWLDPASAATLAYAFRRFRQEHVGLLLTVRTSSETMPLLQSVPAERLHRVTIGPLSMGAIHHLLQARLGSSFPRPVLRRLYETCRGNAFFAIELGRALLAHGAPPGPGEPLPLPEDLETLLNRRLAVLPSDTARALHAAALLAQPTIALVEAALGCMLRLEPALEEGLIELANGRILFTNPLITSALQKQLTPGRREQLHRRLSEIAPNEEERARHLAVGTPAPDRSVAATVERAAQAARLRGAPGTAKELLDESIRLTPVDDERDHIRRTLEATEVSFEAGDTARTLASLTVLRERLGPGHDRAQVLRRLGVVTGELESAPAAIELFEAALSEAQGDRILEAEIHRDLAWMTTWATDLQSAREHARRAVDLGGSTTEASVLAEILAAAVYVEFAIGGGIRSDLLERALVLEGGGAQVRLDRSPTLVKGVILLALDRLDEARTCFETLLQVATDRGDESNVSTANYYIGLVQLRAGNWALAGDRIEEGLEISEQTGVNRQVLTYARSLLDAHLGRVEAASRRAERDVKAWETEGEKLYLLRNLAVLGFLALSCNDPTRAASHLRRARSLAEEIGFGEPSLLLFCLDEVESLVSLGELEKARTLLDSFEKRARELDRGSALAGAERCRGILLAASGDLVAALVALERAAIRYERLPLPFERGRNLLALGTTQRRAKQRRQARKTLEEASHVFEELGARLWLERSRADLRRIGGQASAAGGLTPTEQRVAALVAEGRSNKEVAATLFVTVKTVEANLTRIYPKLGVRSRAELAHRFTESREPSNL